MRKLILSIVVALLSVGAVRADYTYTRDFRVQTLDHYRNLYLTSFPDTIGLQDVANSGVAWTDKCDLRGGPGDGVLNADDAICTLWGSDSPRVRDGRFAIQRLDTFACRYETRAAMWTGPLGAVFVGTPFPIDPAEGYIVYVDVNDLQSPLNTSNTGVLQGPCAPGFPSVDVTVISCPRALIAVPDDIFPMKASEVLCGRAGVDFPDANADTIPDGTPSTATCPNGLWDPVSGRDVAVIAYDNEPGNNPTTANTDAQFLSFSVHRNQLGMNFGGFNFTVRPGSALLVVLSTGYQQRTWSPPVDPTQCP